jgi:hypothetical protein
MPLTYYSGERILGGDRVRYHGDPGVVEFVAEVEGCESATSWYVQQLGPGVMLNVPQTFGSVFVPEPELNEDLDFVSRGDAT